MILSHIKYYIFNISPVMNKETNYETLQQDVPIS